MKLGRLGTIRVWNLKDIVMNRKKRVRTISLEDVEIAQKAARIAELETVCRAALASIGETERLMWASDLYKQLTEALVGEK
jgi:uncharacterized lipoprotein YmbA